MLLHFKCPHCEETVEILEKELNCRIFRHGVFKKNFKQVPPHSSKEKCDKFYNNNEIYGCGKPFKIVGNKENYSIEICEYV